MNTPNTQSMDEREAIVKKFDQYVELYEQNPSIGYLRLTLEEAKALRSALQAPLPLAGQGEAHEAMLQAFAKACAFGSTEERRVTGEIIRQALAATSTKPADEGLDNTFWELVHKCTSQSGDEPFKRDCDALEEYVQDLIYTKTQEAMRALKSKGDCAVCTLGIPGVCYCGPATNTGVTK